MTPKRIQRKRTKGWRMPAGAVYVGRGSKWGSPFKLVRNTIYVNASHRRKILDPWVVAERTVGRATLFDCVQMYRAWVYGILTSEFYPPCPVPIQEIRRELRGKTLCCWCPLNQPCHADVLLELANT